MKCREATEFLSDFLAGTLELEVRTDFEAHLGRCPNCRAFLEQFRTTLHAETLAGRDEDARTVMPEELVRGIMAVVGKRRA